MGSQTGKTVSTSMLYMWRCIVAIAHADGVVHDEERAYLNRIFDNMTRAYGLTAEQRAMLDDDLKHAKKVADLLPYINEPEWRGQLIYFGGILARVDGQVDALEDAILKKLHTNQLASLDMEQIRTDVQNTVSTEVFKHDVTMNTINVGGGFIGVLSRFLDHLGLSI